MRRNWYDIKAAAGDAPAVISIYDEIGMWGVTAKDFIASLNTITSKAITLELNSPGGSVFDALAIFNALKNSGKDITVKVMGIAASAASYLAMVGNKIVMPENTFMMVHNPLSGMYGNAADMREMADILDKIGNSLTATYVARTGKSDEEIRDLLAKDTYLTAAECLEMGFADEVTPAVSVTAKFEREYLPEHIQALFKAEAPAEDDAGDIDPEQPDADEVQATYADQVKAVAEAAGFGDYTAVLALDATLDTIDKVKARVSEIREITALCAVANASDRASKFVSTGKSVADVRTALCDAMAQGESNIDTAQQSSDKPISGVQPSAVKTADIWAARHSKSRS